MKHYIIAIAIVISTIIYVFGNRYAPMTGYEAGYSSLSSGRNLYI